jgi:hypothetical protein
MFVFKKQQHLLLLFNGFTHSFSQATHRRGTPALNHAYTNKLAILVGDFLLARASVSLAQVCLLSLLFVVCCFLFY